MEVCDSVLRKETDEVEPLDGELARGWWENVAIPQNQVIRNERLLVIIEYERRTYSRSRMSVVGKNNGRMQGHPSSLCSRMLQSPIFHLSDAVSLLIERNQSTNTVQSITHALRPSRPSLVRLAAKAAPLE